MITTNDFCKKQIIVVYAQEGEKICINNENLVVKEKDGTIKFQVTCYRLFLVFIFGSTSITTAIIQAAKKFGFYLVFMTASFRINQIIGAAKEGNTLLRMKQYHYNGNGIALHITKNKMINQRNELAKIRGKSSENKDAIKSIDGYISKIDSARTKAEIMAYEGLCSKVYFKNHFDNVIWHGRQPRIKRDYINTTLDIGYTVLFAYIDAISSCFGFDTYCGVLHTQFYLRKSLVCDLVEPFRTLIDHEIKKAINLHKIVEEDFFENECGQIVLKWEESSKYVRLFLNALNANKEGIFDYIQSYYRAFMKGLPGSRFPVFGCEVFDDNN